MEVLTRPAGGKGSRAARDPGNAGGLPTPCCAGARGRGGRTESTVAKHTAVKEKPKTGHAIAVFSTPKNQNNLSPVKVRRFVPRPKREESTYTRFRGFPGFPGSPLLPVPICRYPAFLFRGSPRFWFAALWFPLPDCRFRPFIGSLLARSFQLRPDCKTSHSGRAHCQLETLRAACHACRPCRPCATCSNNSPIRSVRAARVFARPSQAQPRRCLRLFH